MGPSSEGSRPRPTAPLPPEELDQALVRARAGDEDARREVVQSHLRLVWDIVRRFRHRAEDPDDLFQLGCLGLVKALDRFDPSYGTRFSTYAVPLILGEIRRFLRDDSPVRVPRRVKELAYRAWQTQEEMTKAAGRPPSAAELARALGVEAADVVEALEAARTPVSLFHGSGEETEDNPISLIDQVAVAGSEGVVVPATRAPPAGHEEAALLESVALHEALSRLDEKTRDLIRLRFFEDRTQAEVGALLGVSQVQVSRLEKQALLRLRHMLAPDRPR
ncbi:MAG: SigB/SigF/SigG family RNA polymerase sigma factor [Bacillota bacterium]|jgi:RNA polymerase sporulation-specific sigma factor